MLSLMMFILNMELLPCPSIVPKTIWTVPKCFGPLNLFVQNVLDMVQKVKFILEKFFLVRFNIILGLNSEFYYLIETRLN